MKTILFIIFLILFSSQTFCQTKDDVMSEAYWNLWNPEVQAKIDRDIEQHRKADAVLQLKDIANGAEVKVEQISHDFIFGAHIFNFNQLGTTERNRKYKALYGTLFNSATIGFYWKQFEMQPNRLRFREEYWDTEAYWNQVKEPEKEPHWRRPATDPVVAFCESKGIRLHGHPIIATGPISVIDWWYNQFCPDDEKEKINQLGNDGLLKLTPAEIENLIPVYTKELNRLFEKRVIELANYYKGRVHSWDVVNESSKHFHGNCLTGEDIFMNEYTFSGLPGDFDNTNKYTLSLLPGDYAYKALTAADQFFPKSVLLNLNDNLNHVDQVHYANQVKALMEKGCRIDIMGYQSHMFEKQCIDIANGQPSEKATPQLVWDIMDGLSSAGLPIHISEVSIAVDDNEIQKIIARNLYRLWFSIKPVMGITWWNPVDGCSYPGEPANGGLFSRNMEPKPSFYALDQLINHEWKTNLSLKADKEGKVQFRGFKGLYRVSWKDESGKEQYAEFYLKKDGDSLKR